MATLMRVICDDNKGMQKERQNGKWMLQLETGMVTKRRFIQALSSP
jgi:hypothetical protein